MTQGDLFSEAASRERDGLRPLASELGCDSTPFAVGEAVRDLKRQNSWLRKRLAEIRLKYKDGSTCVTCRWLRPWCAYGQAQHVGGLRGCGAWEGRE